MADYNEKNGIRSVGGVHVIAPFTYEWELEDISEADAGRTEDIEMDKKRKGQVCAVTVGWEDITTEQAHEILQAFNPEYINITYLNPLEGGWVTRECYVGNRKAALYNSNTGLWSNLGFRFTERKGVLR